MLKLTYYWKEISDDGLLKEPKEQGPYYSTERLNGWGGFETKEAAIEKLESWHKYYKYGVSNMILVEVYSKECD